MAESKPKAPRGLQARGRAFWRAVVDTYELTVDEVELLREVCRTLDVAEELAAVLDRDGATTTGSVGQTRVHPAVGELRATRLALGRLLGQLGLPSEDGDRLPSPTTVRNRRASAARWGEHRPTGSAVSDAARMAASARWGHRHGA
jgi:phage terminase small subunit